MKSIVAALILTLPLAMGACSVRPQKPNIKSSKGANAGKDGQIPGAGSQFPSFVDSNEPLDSYLSIGPYLQKEFDSAESSEKTIKVYLQVRQENMLEKNFAELKATLGPIHTSVTPALENAQKKGSSTVEFEAQVGALKKLVGSINKSASGLEVSLPAVK